MPYDRRHVLAQWGGTLPGGEIWSNSVRLASETTGPNAEVPTHDAMVAWLEGPAKDAVRAYHQDPNAVVNSVCKLAFLKMNVVDQDGRYVEQNTLEYIYSPVVAGASAGPVHPNQVTLCVSTTTEFSRGYAHRGRWYLPLPAMAINDADGLISAATALNAATAAATFLSALHDQPGLDDVLPGDLHVCVMSKRGTGATNRVIGIDVGRALDTQVRRRVELKEQYQHAPIV